ncbi:MAG: ribonucleoside triphosphate reductase, partial [Casimicrobiaceae bacterium]
MAGESVAHAKYSPSAPASSPALPALVIKRDGARVPFELAKIASAIARAGVATGEFDANAAQALADAVGRVLAHRNTGGVPDIETIQDCVEHTLAAAGWFHTARAYIVYRDRHARLRADRKTLVDVAQSVDEYLDQKDWRVNANANQGYSLGGLILNVSGKVVANYWLSHVYAPEIGRAHRDGDIHIHDLDMLAGYCAGWSLRQLLHEGLNGVPGKVEAGPPKHMSSAVGQIVNFLGTLQNEWAGAQAFSSFDTYMAPFIRRDAMSYDAVKQCIQELIYNLNVPSRWGTQTPFTNLTFDWTCPDDLKDQYPVIGGVVQDFAYGELQVEMDLINRAYMEVMTEGDAKGRVFTFPIPTYNITEDFPWESENADRLFAMTAKYGLPYFQNFVNSELTPNMVRSMCCRLQLDLTELLKRGNGLFGSAEQTGSLGVVTINCARLGHVHRGDEDALLAALDVLLEYGRTSLELKRKVIQRCMDDGLFPYTRRYLGTLRNHFSTLGVNGINEMIRNFTGDTDDITTDWGHDFALRFLDHVRERIVTFQEETGHMYNLEATPAEGTTYRFAREDVKRYPEILQAGTVETPYYTNSSQLPVGFTDDPFDVLARQEDLQRKYTGGTVLHL